MEKQIIPTKYRDILANNIDLIAKAVEPNPREVKRFINNFIVAYEVYGRDERCDPGVLLILQALSVRWDGFYRLIIDSSKGLREDMKRCAELNEKQRIHIEEIKEIREESRRLLAVFKSDHENENSRALFDIEDWSVYRRATEVVKEDYVVIATNTKLLFDMVNQMFYALQSHPEGKISTREFQQRCDAFASLAASKFVPEL